MSVEPDPTAFERTWRRRFERYALSHDDDARIAGWTPSGLDTRFRSFRRLWQHAYGDRCVRGHWLDLGCGAGTYTRFLSEYGHFVTAVDYSLPTAVKARSRTTAPVAWAIADATRLPFASSSFDGVLCFGVMQALSVPDGALSEIRRVLKPGAELWIDALNKSFLASSWAEWRRRRSGRPAHLRYDVPVEFRGALASTKFEIRSFDWLPMVPSSLAYLQPTLDSGFVRSVLRHAPALATVVCHSFVVRAGAA